MEENNEDRYSQKDRFEKEISELLTKMTVEEKVMMCHGMTLFKSGGVERLGIPPLVMSDGPHGVRQELEEHRFKPLSNSDDAGTYFCSLIALASTWNPDIAYKYGIAIGQEARARGKDMLLAPGVNIIRTPLCGRNFEYMSEDPYLVSRLAVPYIKGLQEQDVAACIKHFAANNQETNRNTVNVEMDERTLREIYLPAFEAAVKEGQVCAVMGAYNRFRGQHCCHNGYLLKTILKGEWGFEGVVVSDWNGTHDTMEAAYNGLDIEMGTNFNKNNPYDEYYLAKPFLKAVKEGIIDEGILDDKVRRILRVMYRIGVFDKNRSTGCYNTPEHRKVSLEIARQAVVLLKNDDKILPLTYNNIKTIAVIGDNAVRLHANGGGSSEVKALYEVSPLEGLKNKLEGRVYIIYARGYSSQPELTEQLASEAVDAASRADVAIIFAGLNHDFDTEGCDRKNMKLPYGQPELIEQVYQANPRTVVVMISGSPVEMSPWVDRVPGILQAWYCGMEGGNAIASILFGEVNPSGKLPVTFPWRLEDSPAHCVGEYPGDDTVVYREGIFVGYRYFDSRNVDPMFCFGHGLSYTSFEYSDLDISIDDTENDIKVEVSFNIKNTGPVEGAETAQVYIRDVEACVERPYKELKGFDKVFLKPGEKKGISVVLNKRSLAYFDESKNAWRVEPGIFEVLVGSSSRDIRLKGSFELKRELKG